jgi:hypothetical protein
MPPNIKDKKLLEAVRSFSRHSVDSKSVLLDAYLDELAELVSEGIVLSDILKGLNKVGVAVSKTLLQNYLKSNFPEAYKNNYTSRSKGGRKPGSGHKKPQGQDCQQLSDSTEKQDKALSKNAHSRDKTEASAMVDDFLEQNQPADIKD